MIPVAYRTQLADEDLRSIALQIGIESGRPVAADQIIDELVDRCDQLATLSPISQLGTLVPELGKGVRLHSYRGCVIIFRYLDDGVLILRVVDDSQDCMSWKFA